MSPDSFFITMTISLKGYYLKLYINIVNNCVMTYYVYYALINSPCNIPDFESVDFDLMQPNLEVESRLNKNY